jgi:hypothetical protein
MIGVFYDTDTADMRVKSYWYAATVLCKTYPLFSARFWLFDLNEISSD